MPITVFFFFFFTWLRDYFVREKSPSLFASIDVALAFTLMPHTEVDCERCPILDHVCPLDNQSVVRGACTSSCPRFWWPLLCWSFCSMTSTSVQVNNDGLYFHSVHLWFRIYLSTFVWKLNGKLWVRMDKWWIVFSYPNKCFLPLFLTFDRIACQVLCVQSSHSKVLVPKWVQHKWLKICSIVKAPFV